MEGDLCGVCYQGLLELHQGALVCTFCGSFHASFIEEAAEYEGGGQTRFHRRTVRSTPQERSYAEREVPPVAEAVLAYLGCLQRLLQRQAAALQAGLGVNHAVVSCLERFWLAYLPHTGVLSAEFARRVEHRVKPPQEAGAGTQEGGASAARVPGNILGEALIRVLPPATTLSLCFLACWHLREAVGPLDICRWALAGALPYLRLAADSRPALEHLAAVLPIHFLDVRGVPSPTKVWDEAAVAAACIGLACPPANVGLWLDRWARELALPQAAAVAGLQLHQLYRMDAPQLHLQHKALRPALVHAMALLLVAVKLLYGLDGKPREMPAGAPPAPDWLQWAAVVLGGFQGAAAFPLSVEEALDLPDPALHRYLSHAAAHAFPGGAVPEGLEEHRRLLQRLAEAAAAPAQQAQQPALEGRRPWGGGAEAAVPCWQRLFERAWRPALPPSGAGPPLPPGRYPFFGRAYGTGSGHTDWHLPLDYAAVLLVCAAHVGVTPSLLHSVVSELEDGVIQAELEVAFADDHEGQHRLATLDALGAQAKQQKAAYSEALERVREERPDVLPGFTEALRRVAETDAQRRGERAAARRGAGGAGAGA